MRSVLLYAAEQDEAEEEDILKKESQRCASWVAMETSRMQRHWLPWRPDEETTEEDCEDPERIIPAEDVTPALFSLSATTHQFQLLLGFLQLLGVIRPSQLWPGHPVWKETWRYDLSSPKDLFYAHTNISIFAASSDKAFPERQLEKFVRNVFQQTLPHFSGPASSKLVIAYMDFLRRYIWGRERDAKSVKSKRKETRKSLREVMAQGAQQSDLLAWEQFALTEWVMGEREQARKILNINLQSRVSQTRNARELHDQIAVLKLYRTYAEMELGLLPCQLKADLVGCDVIQDLRPNISKVLALLACLCEGKFESSCPPTTELPPSRILLCRRVFQQRINQCTESFPQTFHTDSVDLLQLSLEGASVEHWTVCSALFAYLTQNIQVASEKYCNAISTLTDAKHSTQTISQQAVDYIVSRLHKAHIELLSHHVQHQVAPLRLLREPLQKALLNDCPEMPFLIQTYINLEQSSVISVQLRRFLAQLSRQATSPIVWLFAVQAEVLRMERLREAANTAVGGGTPGNHGNSM